MPFDQQQDGIDQRIGQVKIGPDPLRCVLLKAVDIRRQQQGIGLGLCRIVGQRQIAVVFCAVVLCVGGQQGGAKPLQALGNPGADLL